MTIFYTLIVIFCANFLGRGSIFALLFTMFALLRMPRKCMVDQDAIFALVLSVSSFVASVCYYGLSEAVKCLIFFPMYLVGLNGYYFSDDRKRFLEKTVFSVFFGYALLVVLTTLSNLSSTRGSGNRLIIYNFWTDEVIASTLPGLLSAVVIGYAVYAIVCQKNRKQKIIAVAALISVMYLNMQTATRTPVVLFVIVGVLMTGLYLINQVERKGFYSFLTVIGAVMIFLIAIWYDVYGIRSYIEATPIFTRFVSQGLDTTRIEIAKEYFGLMWIGILGGNRIQNVVGMQAHNFIQEGYDLYGIFAGISLILLEVSFLMNIIKLLKIRQKQELDFLLISMYFSMIIQANMEPIFTAYPCFFFSILLLHGMANGYLRTRITDYYENCGNQYGALR